MDKTLKEMIEIGDFAPGSRSRQQQKFDTFVTDKLIRGRNSLDAILKQSVIKFPDMNNFVKENSIEDIEQYFEYIQRRRMEKMIADNFLKKRKNNHKKC